MGSPLISSSESGAKLDGRDLPPLPDDEDCLCGARILLAEDNRLNQMVFKDMLIAQDVEVEIANNGLEAFEMAITGRYCLLLMDMHMPNMGDAEATRRLRSLQHLDELPIVALTGDVGSDARMECMEVGMNDFIAEPVSPEGLYVVLRRGLCRG